jgi:PhzF family phenazine biosynthesis protein
MPTYTLYQVDAFAKELFKGNPAAVVPLRQWLPDELMQQIAMENNVSETAFIVPSSGEEADYDIRWFTPGVEINLCGHATLAASWVLFNQLGFAGQVLKLHCKSGLLTVVNEPDGRLLMDFPSWKPERVSDYPENLGAMLGNAEIVGVYQYRDLLVELSDEKAVRQCQPNFDLITQSGHKIIITAPGESKEVDFVSRFFAPSVGVPEDPVTGSAHSQLIPFWSEKLDKKELFAKQLSAREGDLWCSQLNTDRVTMAGYCVYYMKAEIFVP